MMGKRSLAALRKCPLVTFRRNWSELVICFSQWLVMFSLVGVSFQHQPDRSGDISNDCRSSLPPMAGALGSMLSQPPYLLPLTLHLPVLPAFLVAVAARLLADCPSTVPRVCLSDSLCFSCSLFVMHWLQKAAWLLLFLPSNPGSQINLVKASPKHAS